MAPGKINIQDKISMHSKDMIRMKYNLMAVSHRWNTSFSLLPKQYKEKGKNDFQCVCVKLSVDMLFLNFPSLRIVTCDNIFRFQWIWQIKIGQSIKDLVRDCTIKFGVGIPHSPGGKVGKFTIQISWFPIKNWKKWLNSILV